jgi:Kef-type K+ transport system membrane component KefB
VSPTSGFVEPVLAAGGAHVEAVVLSLLLQLIVIIPTARVAAWAFRRMNQPAVVGEIMAGMILGPSLFGKLFPEASAAIFPPPGDPRHIGDVLTAMSQIGLILLLFLVGLEFDFSHLRQGVTSAFWISSAGIVLPFGLGLAIAPVMLPHMGLTRFGKDPPMLEFSFFMGTAMSITALPILGRMMMEMGVTRTRIGALTISSAAMDDACGWILLATVAALVSSRLAGGEFDPMIAARMVGWSIAFAAGVYFIVRPPMVRWIKWTLARNNGELGLNGLVVLLSAVFVCAIATNLIGIFSIFGAFYLGAVLSGQHEFREAVNRALKNMVTAFFLPIFFTYTGLRTDTGTLENATLWLLCGLVLAAAIVGKLGGCGIAARFSGFNAREAACVGVMMNTRALMELVVVNTGYDMGVLTRSSFCMLVIMAVVTTIMTTPILVRTARGTELEAGLVANGFMGEPPAPEPAKPGSAPAGA